MPQLDGLRAFAVGAVMAHHFLALNLIIPFYFLAVGDLGVRLFFVLSGFLITGILVRCRADVDLDHQSSSHKVRQFYVRRFLRIFPIYYLTLGLVAILNLPSVRATLFWHLSYLSNVHFSLVGFDGPLSHFWSLAVEEQFYLIWPWLIVFAPRKYLHKILLCVIIAGPLFRLAMFVFGGGELASYILLFGCMDSLGLGALLAYYASDGQLEKRKEVFSKFSLLVGMLLIVLLAGLYKLNTARWVSVVVMFLAMSLVFVWLVQRAADGFRGIPGAFLGFRPLVYIGKISYGIYIFHLLVPQVLSRAFAVCGFTFPEGPGTTIIRFILFLSTTVGCAALSWHFFEGPINKLKKYFRYEKPRLAKEPHFIESMGTVLDAR